MKRGTTPQIEVSLGGVFPCMVQRVEFIFKQYRSESAKALLTKTYTADGEGEVQCREGKFIVPLTDGETRLFSAGKEFFMDTRITFTDGSVPETDIVALEMNGTLFKEGE